MCASQHLLPVPQDMGLGACTKHQRPACPPHLSKHIVGRGIWMVLSCSATTGMTADLNAHTKLMRGLTQWLAGVCLTLDIKRQWAQRLTCRTCQLAAVQDSLETHRTGVCIWSMPHSSLELHVTSKLYMDDTTDDIVKRQT